MVMRKVFPPYFVVSVDEESKEAKILDNKEYASQKEADDVAANVGVGVINYVVATVAEYDRTYLEPKDIADECAKLLLEATQYRQTSSPQCIPVAMYRKMEKLASQYKEAIEKEKVEKQS
jgi:hypothetical protein